MRTNSASVYRNTSTARKILAIDLGFLGDTVHLVPALWDLKRAYSESELDVLTSTVGADLLQLVSCVNRVWGIEMYPEKRSIRQQWSVLRAVRGERYDLTINFSGADRTLFLTALSGARVKVAHLGGRSHFWNSWFIPIWVPRQDPLLPAYEQRRQVLRGCGIEPSEVIWNLQVPADAVSRAETMVPQNCVHFSINASSPLKEWPVQRWSELARSLLASHAALQIVATGTGRPAEQERLWALAAAVADERLRVLPPGLKLAELAAVLQRCRLHVGGDSGVLHLAVALGLPTVSLFRQYADVSAWTPHGASHRVFTVPCNCVNQKDGPCHPNGPAECLEQLSPSQIAAAVQERLAACPVSAQPNPSKLYA